MSAQTYLRSRRRGLTLRAYGKYCAMPTPDAPAAADWARQLRAYADDLDARAAAARKAADALDRPTPTPEPTPAAA